MCCVDCLSQKVMGKLNFACLLQVTDIYIHIYKFVCVCDFFPGSAAQRGLWPPRPLGFLIILNDAPQSVGLLWTSDQLIAETSVWHHTTHTTDKHPCLRWDSNHDRSRRAVVDLSLRPRGHWDLQVTDIFQLKTQWAEMPFCLYVSICPASWSSGQRF
jgi:hypothetical protein